MPAFTGMMVRMTAGVTERGRSGRLLISRRMAIGGLLAAVVARAGWAAEMRPDVLRDGQMLRGRFVQERALAGFSRPLHSEGDFTLVPGRGLIWRTTAPFASTLVITSAGILQLVNGKEAMRLPASRAPGIGRFYEVLSGALSGNTSGLSQVFHVDQQADATHWQLTLTPLRADDPALATVQAIVVSGAHLVEAVDVRKQGGDVDHLRFTDQQVGPAALTQEETAQFTSMTQ
jgi:Outer membrane lipoprotein carrier protein LolA-like